MKIQPVSVIPMKEQQYKTQQTAGETRGGVIDDAVDISGRGKLGPTEEPAEFTTNDMASLLRSILANPEGAINAQSMLTPDRVLALLA